MVQTHAKATRVDGGKINMEHENMRLHLEVKRQCLLIVDLEEQVRDEKKTTTNVMPSLKMMEFLPFQDAVIEELEAKVK
jgi:hypothetical protein